MANLEYEGKNLLCHVLLCLYDMEKNRLEFTVSHCNGHVTSMNPQQRKIKSPNMEKYIVNIKVEIKV